MSNSVLGFKFESPKSLEKNMRFAAALALTRTADDMKDGLIAALPKHMTIRRTWTAKGFKCKAARKGRNPFSVVGHRDQYMADQSVGATRQRTAVPTKKLRGKPNRVIGKSKFPRALRSKPRHFVVNRGKSPKRFKARARAGERLILRRMGRGGRKLRVQYRLMPTQKIKARFPFHKIGRRVVGDRLEPNIRAAVAKAAKTAR